MNDATKGELDPLSAHDALETDAGRSALPPISIGQPVPPVRFPLPPLLPVFAASWVG